MEFIKINSLEEYKNSVNEHIAVIFYFSHEQCNVCKVLKPKVLELVSSDFNKIKLCYVDIYAHPDIAAQNSILVAPTLLFIADGKETIRLGRHFGMDELKEKLERPYNLMFD